MYFTQSAQARAEARALANGKAAAAAAQQQNSEKLLAATQNGTASKAADYYVRGEVPAELTQRKIQK